MQFRKFKQNKLWRDKVVSILEKTGSVFHIPSISNEKYDQALKEKLREEAEEVTAAKNKNDLIEEIADVFEVIDALCHLHSISHDEIIKIQTKKRDEKGGFFERKYVEMVEHIIGSAGDTYCLKDPKKHPEIK